MAFTRNNKTRENIQVGVGYKDPKRRALIIDYYNWLIYKAGIVAKYYKNDNLTDIRIQLAKIGEDFPKITTENIESIINNYYLQLNKMNKVYELFFIDFDEYIKRHS